MANVYEIRTERLLMRRWRRRDREPFAALNADPEVMRHFPRLLDRVESDAAVDRYEELLRGQRVRALGARAARRRAVPRLHRASTPCPRGCPGRATRRSAGGWRGHAWHQGYATEAARAAVEAAFGPLRLPRLWSMTAVTNTPSQAVMRRIGMRRARHSSTIPAIPRGHAPAAARRLPARRLGLTPSRQSVRRLSPTEDLTTRRFGYGGRSHDAPQPPPSLPQRGSLTRTSSLRGSVLRRDRPSHRQRETP